MNDVADKAHEHCAPTGQVIFLWWQMKTKMYWWQLKTEKYWPTGQLDHQILTVLPVSQYYVVYIYLPNCIVGSVA